MSIKNIFTLILLTFIPALLIEFSYVLFVNITDSFSLPNICALSMSVLLVMLPVMIGIILVYSKKQLGRISLSKMILYKNPLEPKKFILYTSVLFCIGAIVFVLAKPMDNFIYENFFNFIPQKYVLSINPKNHTDIQLLTALFCSIFITGIIGPVVEEIYFRGFLLPRMEWMGYFAPILNAVLFSAYHFWSPWQFITRVIFLVPFCYASYKTKNLKLTIVVHCLFNILGDGISILLMIIH